MKKLVLVCVLFMCLAHVAFGQNKVITYVYINEKPTPEVTLKSITIVPDNSEVWYFETGMENAVKVKILSFEQKEIIGKVTMFEGYSPVVTITPFGDAYDKISVQMNGQYRIYKLYTDNKR